MRRAEHPPPLRLRAALALAALGATAGLGGCLLIAGEFQSLTLAFAIQRSVAEGESLEVHSAVYPHEVKLRKYFVRIAGRVVPANGSPLPTTVEVSAVNEDLASGKVALRFKMSVEMEPDGSFSAVKRYKRDIAPGTLQTVTIEPRGGGIPVGSEVKVCVDVVRSKGDLEGRPCVAAQPPAAGGNVFTVRVLDNSFEPKLVQVSPGDTVRWVLEGSLTNHTTTEMDMIWDSGFAFTRNGAFFEWTPTEDHRDKTFGYACVTHQDCCQMTGSIQVGEDAPNPDDRY